MDDAAEIELLRCDYAARCVRTRRLLTVSRATTIGAKQLSTCHQDMRELRRLSHVLVLVHRNYHPDQDGTHEQKYHRANNDVSPAHLSSSARARILRRDPYHTGLNEAQRTNCQPANRARERPRRLLYLL